MPNSFRLINQTLKIVIQSRKCQTFTAGFAAISQPSKLCLIRALIELIRWIFSKNSETFHLFVKISVAWNEDADLSWNEQNHFSCLPEWKSKWRFFWYFSSWLLLPQLKVKFCATFPTARLHQIIQTQPCTINASTVTAVEIPCQWMEWMEANVHRDGSQRATKPVWRSTTDETIPHLGLPAVQFDTVLSLNKQETGL
jgi:hypothetical protein